jgi:hypothetical protein
VLLLGWDGPDLVRLVDARALLDRTEADRELLAAAAARHRCGLLVDERLAALDHPGLGAETDRRERVAARLRPRAPGAAQFVTSTRGLGPLATVAGTPDFVADRWQLAGRRHLPLAVAQRLRHRWRT